MSDFTPPLSSEPETRLTAVKFVGGTTAVTKVTGAGVTVTYVSTGLVDLVFNTTYTGLSFVGCFGHCFEATTASQLKGYTVVPGVYNTTTRTLRISITGDGGAGAPALVDLAALQWLSLQLMFKATGASG